MLDFITLLSAKSTTAEYIPGGGLPSIDREMVAGALAGLPRQVYLIIRCCYLDDNDTLKRELLSTAADYFGLPEPIAGAAIHAAASFQRCPYCHGGRFNPKTGKPCRQCDGGRYVWTADALAKVTGLDAGEIRRRHYRGYKDAVNEITDDIHDAAEYLRAKLFHDSQDNHGNAERASVEIKQNAAF